MKKQHTKRALLSSLLALLLCVSMLVGTTFAWFTDSVTSGRNQIVAGNLDVVLEYKTNWSDEWTSVDENTKIFKDGALYEPGYTEVVFLRVSNAGSLALKYMLSFNIANEESAVNVNGDEFKLSDYLQIGTYVQDEYSSGFNYADILMPSLFGSRESALKNVKLNTLSSADAKIRDNAPILPGEETAQIVAIVLTMPETVGNEANTKAGVEAPWIELGIRLHAMQYTHEKDSFNNQYDANVDGPDVFKIHNDDELDYAFSYGGQGFIVEKEIPNVNATLNENKSLALNMNNSTLTIGDASDYIIVNKGNLELTGDGLLQSNMFGAVENWGKLLVNNLNIEVKGIKYGFHCKAGEVEINKLQLRSERGGLNVQGGKLTVNSGSFEFSGYYDDVAKKWYNGHAVYAVGANTEVIINGGDFRFTGTHTKQRILCAQDGAKIIVNGGTFGKGGSGVKSTWLWEYGGDIIIYGGNFEFDPSACVAEGYEAVQGADGWWTVSQIAG